MLRADEQLAEALSLPQFSRRAWALELLTEIDSREIENEGEPDYCLRK